MAPASASLVAVVAALASGALALSGDGKTTRYWDCCKPSCAWPDKAAVNQPVLTCDKNDNPLRNPDAKSGCDGGTAYSCGNQIPWAVNDLVSYGFAATALAGSNEQGWCCGCYALTFTSGKNKGKIMIVQSTNTGGDLGSNHFDIQMPGGGVGIFDGCTPQFGGLPGDRYGGVTSRDQCESFPAFLKQGCYWRFDWFKNADNPNIKFEQIQCPAELVERTGCRRNDDAQFPVYTLPKETTWTPPQPSETAAPHSQCDSSTWDVPKACPAGYYCKMETQYHWQCTPGEGPVPTSQPNQQPTTQPQPTQQPQPTSNPPPTGSGSPLYGQCGGIGWSGPTTCATGKCSLVNEYYSQCLP